MTQETLAGTDWFFQRLFKELHVLCFKSFFWFILSLFFAASDLSEQIKAATKDNHVRAENTQLMLSYQKGQITLPQYKVNSTHQRPPVNTFMGSMYVVLNSV